VSTSKSPKSGSQTTSAGSNQWAGQSLGLPQSGSGSIATMPRRIFAICIDWGTALLLSHAFAQDNSAMTLFYFTLMQWIFVATMGASVGHRISGLRVVRLAGGWIGIWRPLGRALLLALVIPVAIWDNNNRGLHDKAVGTVLVRA